MVRTAGFHHFILLSAAVGGAWSGVLAQNVTGHESENATERLLWQCSIHKEIISSAPGFCPICGRPLKRFDKRPEHLVIPDGTLEAWCRQHTALQFDRLPASAPGNHYDVVAAYLLAKGSAGMERVRHLLASECLHCVAAAAYWLGTLPDLTIAPKLERLLLDKRFQPPSPSPGAMFEARLAIAEALHRMGNEKGTRALKEMAHGGGPEELAVWALRLRDCKDVRLFVRELLKPGARTRTVAVTDAAADVEIALGLDGSLAAARRRLQTVGDTRLPRAIIALGESPLMGARHILEEIVDNEGEHDHRKVLAAAELLKQGDAEKMDLVIDWVVRADRNSGLEAEIDALGRRGGKKQLFVLQRLIEESPRNRWPAIVAVLRILSRGEE